MHMTKEQQLILNKFKEGLPIKFEEKLWYENLFVDPDLMKTFLSGYFTMMYYLCMDKTINFSDIFNDGNFKLNYIVDLTRKPELLNYNADLREYLFLINYYNNKNIDIITHDIIEDHCLNLFSN